MEPRITSPEQLTTGQQVAVMIDGCLVEGEILIDEMGGIFLLHDDLSYSGQRPAGGFVSKHPYSWWIGYNYGDSLSCCSYVIERKPKKWNHQ